MANTDRRVLDNNDNQFMPMNVEGGTWDENFISTKKLVFIGIVFFSLLFIILTLADMSAKVSLWIISLILWAFVSQLILRYIVFEERFYYKMYKKLSKYEITTPAMFWDVASINDTFDGAIITYSDTKIGILIRIERDTITGKHPDFKEIHYDAISDFYRELMVYKYNFVQMNVMEQAGNDPRLESLDALVNKSDNANIRELMEKEIGYIKNITHNSLYESDYILVYTTDLKRVDSIIDDVIECMQKILDGAYIGYRILSSREIIDFVKETYGVKYFNYTQATLDMFRMNGVNTTKPFKIVGIKYEDGMEQEIGVGEINKIYSITSEILSGELKNSDISIRDTLLKNRDNNKNKVDFDDISKGFTSVEKPNTLNRPSKRIGRFNKSKNMENQNPTNSIDEQFFNNSMDIEFNSWNNEDDTIDF